MYGGFVPWRFLFTCPVWVNLTVRLQHTLYSRVSLFEPQFLAGPYHHMFGVVPFIARSRSRSLVNGTNLHALPMNEIFVNIEVHRSFMFILCQGYASKSYKLRAIYIEWGFVYYFYRFYNVVWNRSNLLTSIPLHYLCNGRAMDDSFPFLNSSCFILLFPTRAKTGWMIQTR
jgi:hypothetical protein